MKGYKSHLSDALEKKTLTMQEAGVIQAYLDDYSSMISPSQSTLRNKYFLLYTLMSIFRDTGTDPEKAVTTDILHIISTIKNRNEYSDNYKRMLVSLLKSLCNSIPGADMKKIKSVKLPKNQWKTKKPEDMLTKDEVLAVLSACSNSRDRCLLSMIYDGSNRIIELLRLNWNDLIHDPMGYYFETDAKTGHKRKIRFTSSIPHIEQWEKDYPMKPDGDNPVFVIFNKPYTRLTRGGYETAVRKLRDKTGIKKLKPGIMRSTRITHDVAAGQDVQYIMLKNWGNLKTSMLDKYTNLSGDYIDSKALEYAGLKKVDKVQQTDPMQPVQCPKCYTINEPGNKHCRECGKSLTKEGEDELSRIRDAMTPEEWIQFWQWKKDHP